MLKDKINHLLRQAVTETQQKGLLPPLNLPEALVEPSQGAGHGDYASSLPLRVARTAGLNPLDIARMVVESIPPTPEIEKVEVAPPGFINFTLKKSWLTQQVSSILQKHETYGNLDLGRGTRVQVEFVSVNPTGPLHVGHGRGAVIGSTLANVLAAAGYSVQKEYYINDAGTQMDVFYQSLYARYQQALGLVAEVPADGYHGAYMMELAKEIIAEQGDRFLKSPPDKAIPEVGQIGMKKMLDSIGADAEALRVHFDVWFSEKSLYEGTQYRQAMSLLRDKGYVADRESATWFASSALGEDKDNVLVRSNGVPTYFASDIAYHYNKFLERGFDRVINVWGADHQGHVPRMKAAVSALGVEPHRFQVIITQMVTLKKGNVELKISKRSGELITLREVVEEVGPDACRFFFLSRSASSQMDFDLELAKKESAENPVYYVQYGHARIASILRLARERGIDWNRGDVSLLIHAAELSLIRKMIQLPEVVETIARNLEPEFLPHYAQELATAFHNFYEGCRVISQDDALTQARLKLVEAAGICLARVLHLMGMAAPEKM